MTYPGLHEDFAPTLLTHHTMRVRIQVLKLNMKPTGQDITATLMDGQVNVDADAEVTRSFTATFSDPDRQLVFDPNSPADGALYVDRMLRVWYGIRAGAGPWLEVPIFTGPIVSYSRDGTEVEVECQGKEHLALGATWDVDHHKKHKKKVQVIRDTLHAQGERHFGFGSFKAKLPDGVTVPAEVQPWVFAQRMAKGMGAQLYYDGWGRCRLRRPPSRTAWTFRSGDGGSILTPPRVTYDVSNLRNAVRVVGKKPSKNRPKVRARAVAPAAHPFSPKRSDPNDRPLPYWAEFIDDSKLDTEREAQHAANTALDRNLVQHVNVEADTLVVPHLDEGDPVRYITDDFTVSARLGKFTIPLTAAGTMSVGYHRKVSRPRRRRT